MINPCDVCIYPSFDGDTAEFCTQEWVTARRSHRCCECKRLIVRGECYEKTTGKWYDTIDTYRTCAECQEIRVTFCCESWVYGQLWQDAADGFFEHMTTACLEQLVTAKAKAVLVAKWNEWKFA